MQIIDNHTLYKYVNKHKQSRKNDYLHKYACVKRGITHKHRFCFRHSCDDAVSLHKLKDIDKINKWAEKKKENLEEKLKKNDLYVIYEEIRALNEKGKPKFKNSDIYFNISHSHNLISIGIGKKELGIDISSHMFLQHSSLGQPLTMLYRKSMFDFRWSKQYRYYRDTHEIYHLLMVGKGMFLNFVGATHIQHNTGVSAKLDIQNRALVACKIFNELYTCNTNDCKLKKMYIDTLLWTHSILFKWSFVKLLYKVFFNCPSVSLSVLYTLIKRNFKHYISR